MPFLWVLILCATHGIVQRQYVLQVAPAAAMARSIWAAVAH